MEHVADGLTLERLACRVRDRCGVEEERLHRRSDHVAPGPVVGETSITERRFGRSHQSCQRFAHGATVASPAMATPLERRVPLAHLPTPLEPMERLGARLGMAPGALWVKRDDATGLAGGGNKARKLEYLCADAIEQGCETLVTGGGRQSNHVRMTAAAANRLGLACTIVLGADEPATPTGNVVLDHLLAPEIVWGGPLDYYAMEDAIRATCAPRR